jgi:hypothetical protein
MTSFLIVDDEFLLRADAVEFMETLVLACMRQATPTKR